MLSTQHSCYRVLSTPFFRHRDFKTSVQGLPTNNRAQSSNSSPDFRRLENCASLMTCTVWCYWRRTRMHEFQNCQLESSHSTGDGVCIHCENRRTQLELGILIHPPVYMDTEEQLGLGLPRKGAPDHHPMQRQLKISSGNQPRVLAHLPTWCSTRTIRIPHQKNHSADQAAEDKRGWGEGDQKLLGYVYLLLAQSQGREASGGDTRADPEGQRIPLIAHEQ